MDQQNIRRIHFCIQKLKMSYLDIWKKRSAHKKIILNWIYIPTTKAIIAVKLWHILLYTGFTYKFIWGARKAAIPFKQVSIKNIKEINPRIPWVVLKCSWCVSLKKYYVFNKIFNSFFLFKPTQRLVYYWFQYLFLLLP